MNMTSHTTAQDILAALGAVTWTCSGMLDGGAIAFTLNGRDCDANTFFALLTPASRSQFEHAIQSAPSSLELKVDFANGDSAQITAKAVGDVLAGIILPMDERRDGEYDALTGLYSRAAFLGRLDLALQAMDDINIATFDLDRMSKLNETLGPDQADRLLSTLAGRLLTSFGWGLVPARVGEDEFAVILPNQDANSVEHILDKLQGSLSIAGVEIFPTFSVGLAQHTASEGKATAIEVLRRAEGDLKAKRQKVLSDKGHTLSKTVGGDVNQLVSEADLRHALNRNQIIPFYQPVVDIETGQIKGFEALMRWQHPKRGLLPPDDFLAMALELNLLEEFGRHILFAAGDQLAEWQRMFATHDVFVSLNISSCEIGRDGLIDDIKSIVDRGNLKPGALRIEVTEQQILHDFDMAVAAANAMKAAGASLALDDFGTGFSSLSYLAKLPVDVLKIDRYFVRTMASNMGSAHIVRSIIDLARNLDLDIVAEGVEGADVRDMLKNFGCQYAQGFRYAPALPADEATDYIKQFMDPVPTNLGATSA